MNSNAPQRIAENGYGAFIAVCVVYIAAVTLAGSAIMNKRDM